MQYMDVCHIVGLLQSLSHNVQPLIYDNKVLSVTLYGQREICIKAHLLFLDHL